MDLELKILHYEDIKQDLITFFKRKNLIPIVGSGISCGVRTRDGVVPSGKEYMQHMLKELESSANDEEKGELHKENFSTICDYYEDSSIINEDKRFTYLKNNFYGADFDKNDIRKNFFDINWPYIYSLNIDDAIERSSKYKTIILPKREFREEIFEERKCLIKLHGDIEEIVKYKDGSKIFTSREYALSLDQNAPLLNKLRNDYSNQNILYIGCSLDDEIDLMTLSEVHAKFNKKTNLRKTIIFIKGSLGKFQKSKYKKFGITDIITFDDYDSMYTSLMEAWEESKLIMDEDLIGYENISIIDIKSNQESQNYDYFFWGKGLLNPKDLVISYPYYFILRDMVGNIIENLINNKIHIVRGRRISGKSYLLAGLYREIHDRKVYYFDGRSKLSNKSLQKIFTCSNTVVLFDVGAVNHDQFKCILGNVKEINKNKNNFIICFNDNDSDINGIIDYNLRMGNVIDSDLITYKLFNKFKENEGDSEKDKINKLLPVVKLPRYRGSFTILDHIIHAENILESRSRFTNYKINITHYKQLALLLILAIKERMSSLDVTSFALDQEIWEALKRYNPLIERVETPNYEKDSTDLSSIKYILNSKYWLRRELGMYAQSNNYSIIVDAYKYIIHKAMSAAGSDAFLQRKNCKNYILFDILNDIFLTKYGGKLKLIVRIYNELHDQLATDYNFLHQRAKCLVNYSYTLKRNEDIKEKESLLLEAKKLAAISKSTIDGIYEETNNEYLLISSAHVQFTIASIQCNICKIHKYSNIDEIRTTIDVVNEALQYLYNVENNKIITYNILNFIKTIFLKNKKNNILNSKEYSIKIANLMTQINRRQLCKL